VIGGRHATTFSANISSAEVTDVPDLSRKAAMVAVSEVDPATDSSEATTTESGSGTTEAALPKNESPKADKDEDAPATKEGTSATTDKPEDPPAKSPKQDAEKGDAAPKHDAKKADNEAGSEGAEKK
jgi:hypothetical protein